MKELQLLIFIYTVKSTFVNKWHNDTNYSSYLINNDYFCIYII